MYSGAITDYIDVAQLVLYAFWIFFAGLIYYLHQENKREGYPLETDPPSPGYFEGFPRIPDPKTYLLPHGGTFTAPDYKRDTRPINATPIAGFPGAPLEPNGDPMLAGVGPGSWAERADVPDLTWEGAVKIVPLRVATDCSVEERDPDPRGMSVVGADGAKGGTVVDVWVDRAEFLVRYLELETAGKRRVLLPINFAKVHGGRGEVSVRSILGGQFEAVPGLRKPDEVTFLEEEKIMAYFGAGTLYAEPSRAEPIF
jgi:photosynthetic reaction center H subunit